MTLCRRETMKTSSATHTHSGIQVFFASAHNNTIVWTNQVTKNRLRIDDSQDWVLIQQSRQFCKPFFTSMDARAHAKKCGHTHSKGRRNLGTQRVRENTVQCS